MLKKLLKISLAITGSLVLIGCDIDDSFTTTSAPVYSNGAQVRSNNQVMGTAPVYSNGGQVISGPVGRSPNPGSNEYNTGGVVSNARQPAVTVTQDRSLNTVNSNVPAVVQTQPAPVVSQPATPAQAPTVGSGVSNHSSNVIPVISSPQEEPVMRSTPSPA